MMLEASEEYKKLSKISIVVFRRAPNLNDDLYRLVVRGCFPLGKLRSLICSFVSEGRNFISTVS